MNHKTFVMACAGLVMFVAFGLIAPNLGSEFVAARFRRGDCDQCGAADRERFDDSDQVQHADRATTAGRIPDEIAHVWSRSAAPRLRRIRWGLSSRIRL